MKRFGKFITEKESDAHKEAMAAGLKYAGFGRYVDRDGKLKARTQDGQLVFVNDTAEIEDDGLKDQEATKALAGPEAEDQQPMASPGDAIGLAGGNVSPFEEDEIGWESGPEGDTCVGDEPKPTDLKPDTWAPKFNNPKWLSGPDGSNYTNPVAEETLNEIKADWPGKSQGEPLIPDSDPPVPDPENLAKQRMKKILGKKPASGRTDREAQDALNQMRANPDQQTILGKQLASMMKIANREAAPDPFATNIKPPNQSDKERNERNKEADMWRKAAKLPAIKKDADAVTEMNKAIQPLLKDPNFDMEVDYDEDSIGEGAFGQVFKKGDNVIKMGQIGPDELKALYTMRDNPSFPTLINARFDTPFQQYSAEYNNPMNADNERRGPQGYWDPDEASDFEKRFPGAEGVYAMTAAKGVPLFDAFGGYSLDGPPPDPEMEDKVMRNFWRARGQLHKAGFSHNDMHGGNVFVDPDTGEVSIIDLGLAKDDPRSALMEALGGMDYENQEDYQMAHQVAGAQLPERLRNLFDKNRGNVEQMIMDSMPAEASEYDDYDEDQDYSPQFERSTTALQDMLRGGIRMKREDLDQLGEDIPFLKDDNNIKKLIKTLYSEVGQSELADRMSDAFERKKLDTDVIRKANAIRASKGQPKIDLKNRNVIPPENLDWDD